MSYDPTIAEFVVDFPAAISSLPLTESILLGASIISLSILLRTTGEKE